jgi:hypothetical protein
MICHDARRVCTEVTAKAADAAMVRVPGTDRLPHLPSKRRSKPATMGVASNERDFSYRFGDRIAP